MVIPSKHNGYTRDGIRLYPMDSDDPAPDATTRITEQGPTTEKRTSSTKLPDYVTANTKDIFAKAKTIGDTPYTAYGGPRVAEFTPDMLTAMERMRTQGVAGEINQAAGLAGLVGDRAMEVGSNLGPYAAYTGQGPSQYTAGTYNPYEAQGPAQYTASQYNPYEMGGFNAAVARQYMDPYMQNVVDIERRKAQEAADRQSAILSGQAAKQGAFGGSGAALQQRALTRDTAQELADIQNKGLSSAYNTARDRFAAEEAARESSRQFGAEADEASRQFGAKFGEESRISERDAAEKSRQFGAEFGEGSRQFGAKFGEESRISERDAAEKSRQFGADYALAGEKLGLEGLQTSLDSANTLRGLGTDRFSQETDIIKNLGTSGDIQRQREQDLMDVDYADFLEKQGYDAKQLALQKSLTSGLEYDTSKEETSVTDPGKKVEQVIGSAAGGIVGRYAEGGITSLLSDQQIDQRQQMPISDLARMALQAEEMERARMYADQQNMMAQQAVMQQPQGTVYENEMNRIAAIERGIGGLQVPDDLVGSDSMAGGGIVAFSEGGGAFEPSLITGVGYEPPQESSALGRNITRFFTRNDDVDALIASAKRKQAEGIPLTRAEQSVLAQVEPSASGIAAVADGSDNRFARGPAPDMSGTRGREGIAQLIPKDERKNLGAADTGTGTRTDTGSGMTAPSPKTRSSMLDDIYNPMKDEIRSIRDAERKALEDAEKDIKDEAKEGNSFTDKARERINARLKGLEGEDKNIAEDSILKFGYGLLAASGEKNKRKALAELGLNTIKGNSEAVKALQAKQERYEDAELELQKIEMGDRRATRAELRQLQLKKTQAETNLSKSMVEIMGKQGSDAVGLYKAQLTAGGSGSRGSEKERLLAQLAKFPAGTKEGDQLRQNLEYLGEVGKPDPALKDPNYKKKSDLLGMLEMRYSMTQDPKIKAQLESQINNTKIEMAGMLRGGSKSSGTTQRTIDFASIK